MAKKNNKTSHVLNLITGSAPEAEATEIATSTEPSAASTPVPTISEETVASLEAASEEHAAALRENTAALLENAAALRESAAEAVIEASETSTEPVEEKGTEAVQTPGPEVAAPAPPTSQPEQKVIVVDETTENDKLSNTIMNRLADHLEEMEGAAGAAVEEPVLEPEIEIGSEPKLEPEMVQEPEPVVESAEEEAVEESILAQEPEQEQVVAPEPVSESELEESYHMINVMELILQRQNLLKQMNDYGVCTCSRCRTDVTALTLTRLPSKYVVVDKSSTAPIIGYYESKFRMRMFTEIMKACIKVKDEPRHEV